MMICLKNGEIEYVYDLSGMMRLIGENLGADARRWLEEYFRERDADETEFREHQFEVMVELRVCSVRLSDLVMDEEIDRGAIIHETGKIDDITRKWVSG